jgi:hypothetical protein
VLLSLLELSVDGVDDRRRARPVQLMPVAGHRRFYVQPWSPTAHIGTVPVG